MKTPITYYGGKTNLLSHILPLIPLHDVYTEVFFGGGAVFFAKDAAKNETINDLNDVVINFYQVLKSNYKQLNKLIQQTLVSKTQHSEALALIKLHNKLKSINKSFSYSTFEYRLNLAYAFWICTNLSYSNKIGGGLKFSNDKSVNVAQSLKSKKAQFTERLVARIENATIENSDALTILNTRNVKNAFHYIDSPYPGADNGHYKGYTWQDYEMLLHTTEQLKGKFLFSNYNSELLDRYINKNGWFKTELTLYNNGNNFLQKFDHKKMKTEVLVRNYESTHNTAKMF